MTFEFDSASSERYNVSTLPAGIADAGYPFTIACWFNVDDTSNRTICSISDGGASGNYHRMRVGAGRLLTDSDGSAFQQARTNASTVAIDTWYHATSIVAAANDRTIVLAGVQTVNDTGTATTSGMDRLGVASRYRSGNDDHMDGEIADLGVWNVALSAAERAQHQAGYSALLIRPDALVFYMPMVREAIDLMGSALTVNGTPAPTAHRPITFPVRPQIITAPAAAPAGGRIMSSLAAAGGLAGSGGIAGKGGGLAA